MQTLLTSLPYPNAWHLKAAEGWLSLGRPDQAILDLQKIPTPWRDWPEVQEVLCRLRILEKDWAAALEVSIRQALCAPHRAATWIHHAYCLHELNYTERAAGLLLRAAVKFPNNPLIAFNLACYCCHLNQFSEALRWVRRAADLWAAPQRSPTGG